MVATKNLQPRGVYCQLEELIALRFQGGQLQLKQRKKALSLLAGSNKTNFRGRGIDFEEVRRYQPGDDIRTIDWRVTARSGSAHTKLFREERERPLLVVVDQRSDMFFGSRGCFKSVTAAHIAAILAWSGLQVGDRVGGLIFSDNSHHEIRPKRSRQSVLALLHHLAAMNQALPHPAIPDPFQFSDMLRDLRRIARPGTAIFIISDFNGANSEQAREQFHQLSRHTEVTAIHVSDQLERELPPSGRYTVSKGDLRAEVATGNPAARSRYRDDHERETNLLKDQLNRSGAPFLQLDSGSAALEVLQRYYGKTVRGSMP